MIPGFATQLLSNRCKAPEHEAKLLLQFLSGDSLPSPFQGIIATAYLGLRRLSR